MAGLYPDTHPQMEALQIEMIRRMPAWKKMAMVDSLNETVRILTLSGIRQRHPGATAEQTQRLLAETMLGEELAGTVIRSFKVKPPATRCLWQC